MRLQMPRPKIATCLSDSHCCWKSRPNAEKNLIGFAADSEGGREYYTFSYDEKQGFTCTMHEEINGNNMRITRGIYIEDTLYVIQGNIIEAYSLKDFKKVDDIIL